MDFVSLKKRENKDHFGPLSTVAQTKLSPRVLCAPLKLPKEAEMIDITEASMDARDLLKENTPETKFHGCQTNWAVCSEGEHESAIHRINEKSTKSLCKQKGVRRWSLDQKGPKASQSNTSASFKNRALSKARKLGPITYRGARTMTEQLCKTQLHLLKHHLKDRSDLFDDRDTLLHEIATAYPKYSQIIWNLPVLLNLFPGELKERLMIEENVKLLKMGAYLVNKWITRPA
ncbi:unnamed protein product [Penicillium salamii]|nr:unnamed protein product [Penicillium salamii]CAG8366775.1 unnamed protein product [Penicillium salamii]